MNAAIHDSSTSEHLPGPPSVQITLRTSALLDATYEKLRKIEVRDRSMYDLRESPYTDIQHAHFGSPKVRRHPDILTFSLVAQTIVSFEQPQSSPAAAVPLHAEHPG